MPASRGQGQRPSTLLDAVFERLEDPRGLHKTSSVFRAEALASLDVAEEIDNRLTLVARRTWLAMAGIAMLVAAATVASVLVPIRRTVSGVGRALEAPGVVKVEAAESGRLEFLVPSGTEVRFGDEIARVVLPTGRSRSVTAESDGRIWQEFVAVGEFVEAGEVIVTLLPDGDGRSVLVAVTESAATQVRVGMTATLTFASLTVSGVVQSVGPPLAAQDVADRLALSVDESSPVVVLVIAADEPLPVGSPVTALVSTSKSTVMRSILHSHD